MHEQPQNSREAVREPAHEQGADQAQEIVEHGDGFGDHEGDHPDGDRDADPARGALPRAPRDVLRAAEDPHEDVLGGDVAVDDAGDDDGGDGDAPDGPADLPGPGGRERGRGHVGPHVDVDDDGGDQVQRRVADLQERQRLGPVLGLLELRHDAEEARVPAERDRDVGHGQERRREPELLRHVQAGAADGPLHGHVDHRHHDGGEDREEGWRPALAAHTFRLGSYD